MTDRDIRINESTNDSAAGPNAPPAADAMTPTTGPGRPPIEHRFKKGQSGNPAGRPRRTATGAPGDRLPGADEPTRQMIIEEAHRPVLYRTGNREVEMPINRAVFRVLGDAAMQGNRAALRQWTRLVHEAEAAQRRDQVAIHNAVERSGPTVYDLTGRVPKGPDTAHYEDDIIFDRKTGVAVVRRVDPEDG